MIDVKRLAVDADYWLESDPSDGEATHFEPLYSDHECSWVRVDRKGLRHYFYNGGWVCADKTSDDIGPVSSMIPRPQPQPEWVDGLPPVGCECEVEHLEAGNWVNAKVIGYDGPACVVALDGYGYVGSKYPHGFRPIPTPEQRQREELENYVYQKVNMAPMSMDAVDAAIDAAAEFYQSRYTLEPKP